MKNIKEFLSLFKPYKEKALITFIAILMANLLGLAFPWVIKIVIDKILVNKDTALLNLVAGGLILIFALKACFGYIREYLVSFMGESVVCDLRDKILWHLQRLSVKYIEDTSTGKIISGVIGDVESIKKFLFGGVVDFLYAFFNIFFVLTILFLLDWRLTLISCIYLPALGITFFKLTPYLKQRHRSVRDKYAEFTSKLSEVFSGIRIVAGLAKDEDEIDGFSLKQREIFHASMKSHRLGALMWMASEFISSLGLITMVFFGARSVFTGRISPGTLVAFYSYLGMLFFPIIKMVIINNFYQEAAASMDRIEEFLSHEPKIKRAKHPVLLDEVKGNIRFKGVSFSYDGEREVLSGVDFEVKESQTIALVGKSGAGKTTIINLLLRFYDPTQGAVFIDGYNLKDLELKSYRSKIAMVLQDDYLFSATIKENICYSRPEASLEEIITAAQLANAHQFITELPDEYETEIGERGIKLSYGQRQRISIARAILRNPSILILDEATSNIDSETERAIVEDAFKNLMHGRTTFIISHRLPTLAHADIILFIEDRRIVERGRHVELLLKEGNYWRMWQEQVL